MINIKGFYASAPKWFILYFTAMTISRLGSLIYLLALPWLVMQLTGSAMTMGITFMFQNLPSIILGPFIGSFIDKVNKKIFMIFCDLARTAIVLGLVIYSSSSLDHQIPWIYYSAGLLLGLLSHGYGIISEFLIIPQLMDRKRLGLTNSLYFGMKSITQIIAPVFAGFLIATIGPAKALLFDAASYIVPMIIISLMPLNAKLKVGNESWRGYRKQLQEGISFFKSSRVIKTIGIMEALSELGRGSLFLIITYYFGNEVGWSSQAVGILFSLSAISDLAASLLIPKLTMQFDIKRIIIFTLIGSFICFALMSLSIAFMIAVAFCIEGVFSTMRIICSYSLRQSLIPVNYAGTVNSFIRTLNVTATSISALLLNGLISYYGSFYAFLGTAIIAFSALTVTLLSFRNINSIESVNC